MEIAKQQKALNKAVSAIKKGKIVICPTDTVYGFIVDASNKVATAKIFRIKKRAKSKPLPLFVKDLKMAKDFAEIDATQEKILKKKWPGKFTFVVKRKKGFKLYDGEKDTIALRIPKHKFLNDLLKKANRPLAQTSVNLSGETPLTKISDIINQFAKQDILIIDGGILKKSNPSKIIDLTGLKIKTIRK
jgi:L-threonylcarbamoyladenylate synthase